MVSRLPTWSLFYKKLNKNPVDNQKAKQIMGLSQFQLPTEEGISNLTKDPGLAMLRVNGW